MLNVISFVFNLIRDRTAWLYGACIVGVLWYMRSYSLARRSRQTTIFTIEREVAAHREGQAMSGIGVMLGLMVVIGAIKYLVVPTVDLAAVLEVPPTVSLAVPTRAPATATPTATPVTLPTVTPRPTSPRQPLATPTAATVVPPATALQCPDPNVNLSAPLMNGRVTGQVALRGTARNARFQFYKVEYAQGENPTRWNVISVVHYTPVADGILEVWDTTNLPEGTYWVQLTVVDQTGNFPPPCRVRVTVYR